MQALWDAPARSSREIKDSLSEEKAVALTTVLTVLDRLVKKGLAERSWVGDCYRFSPVYSRKQYDELVTREILEGLMEKPSRPILSTFVDLVSHDEDLLKELEELVRRKRR